MCVVNSKGPIRGNVGAAGGALKTAALTGNATERKSRFLILGPCRCGGRCRYEQKRREAEYLQNAFLRNTHGILFQIVSGKRIGDGNCENLNGVSTG
jgi:hypothetical protein